MNTPLQPAEFSPGIVERSALAAKYFRGLGDPTRLRILELLLERERHVGELVELIGSPQGRISSHLACLKWCGFVTTRRAGKFIFYQVSDPRVRELLGLAQAMLADNAERVWSCTRIESPNQ